MNSPCCSKALPHNQLGEVDINAYQALIEALTTGSPDYFESIPLGGVTKLTDRIIRTPTMKILGASPSPSLTGLP